MSWCFLTVSNCLACGTFFFIVVKYWLYSLLGTFAEVFPEYMISQSDRLVSIYINVLKSEVLFKIIMFERPRKKMSPSNFGKIEHCQNNSKFCMQLCLCVLNIARYFFCCFLVSFSINFACKKTRILLVTS